MMRKVAQEMSMFLGYNSIFFFPLLNGFTNNYLQKNSMATTTTTITIATMAPQEMQDDDNDGQMTVNDEESGPRNIYILGL